jgi:outer membrane protein OmpA-like peptidoglycan-associated protein
MKKHSPLFVAATLALWTFAGCATTPPELVEARSSYRAASMGPAGQLALTELYDAKKVLDQAEREFAENGATRASRDYSYVAQRKVQLADVKARTEADRQKIAAAERAGVVLTRRQAKDTTDALATTRAELKDTKAQLKRADGDTEKEARMAGAMRELESIASVRDDVRGKIITLQGSALFGTGDYRLLSTATQKLDQIAEALKAQGRTRRMFVEGHTDNLDFDDANQGLSASRANAVRDYLIGRGVEASQISAKGLGSLFPIDANTTPENRANNRRVEIVISAVDLDR